MNAGGAADLTSLLRPHKIQRHAFCFLISQQGNIWDTSQSPSTTQAGGGINGERWYRQRLPSNKWARPFSLETLTPTDSHKPEKWPWWAGCIEITKVVEEKISPVRRMCHDDASNWKSSTKFGQTFKGIMGAWRALLRLLLMWQAEATSCHQHSLENEPNKERPTTSKQVGVCPFPLALLIPIRGASADREGCIKSRPPTNPHPLLQVTRAQAYPSLGRWKTLNQDLVLK